MQKHKSKAFLIPLLIIITFEFMWLPPHEISTAEIKTEIKQEDLSGTHLSKSYILQEVKSKEILLSDNETERKAPASTTKLLTGLVALNYLSESDMIEVGDEVNVEGSRLGLTPGAKISVQDLLTAMYLMSANDAAAALAVGAKGSLPDFARAMNEYALTIGCQNSNFVNPHGLSEPNHYTTASDLGKIALVFIENRQLMRYVIMKDSQVTWTDSNGRRHSTTIHNTNKLLTTYPGNQGLKTGTTEEAGQCLVSYTTGSDGDLLLVLLGSQQRYADAVDLFDQAWAKLRPTAALEQSTGDPTSLIDSQGFFP
ncbi:MAG: D-alanyl-D-alanine carboxypeptidase family protein [Desulfitobacteriaceae bacterium]